MPGVHDAAQSAKGEDACRGRLAWTIHRYESIDSTNLEVLRLAENGADPGTVVCARTQTAGRGRLGRSWMDLPDRCLLMSVLLEAPTDAGGLLTAAMALAATEAIEALEGPEPIEPGIKWPNDVLIEGRKVAGVLAEGPAGGPVAVGLGVNVNGAADDLPDRLHGSACFISEYLSREVAIAELEAAILRQLSAVYVSLSRGERPGVVESLNRYDCLKGSAITVTTGRRTLKGTALGWLPDGRLMLRGDDGSEIKLDAGEVTLN